MSLADIANNVSYIYVCYSSCKVKVELGGTIKQDRSDKGEGKLSRARQMGMLLYTSPNLAI